MYCIKLYFFLNRVMEEEHEEVLRRNLSLICEHLDFSLVSVLMIENKVITYDEDEMIRGMKTRTERAQHFISILRRKGRNSFNVFLLCIRQTHQHLFEVLSAGLCDPQPPMCPRMRTQSYSDVLYADSSDNFAIHQAVSIFKSKRAERASQQVLRLRETTQFMNGSLASFNLPAALEDLSTESQTVPPSVLHKADKVRSAGGATRISQQMTDISGLLRKCESILAQTETLITEEQRKDEQMRHEFSTSWTMIPSEKLTKTLKNDSAKYKLTIREEINNFGFYEERFREHRSAIELLSQPSCELHRSLPSSRPSTANQRSPAAAALSRLMDDWDVIKKAREVIERELKEADLNMESKFSSALKMNGTESIEAIITENLDALFKPLEDKVSNSIYFQKDLLANIQRANAEFVRTSYPGQLTANRENKLKELAAAFNTFNDLNDNLESKAEYYRELKQQIERFWSKVNGVCMARGTEREHLQETLTDQDPTNSRMAVQSACSIPAPHQPSLSQRWRSTNSRGILIAGDFHGGLWSCSDYRRWQMITDIPMDTSFYGVCVLPKGFIMSGGYTRQVEKSCFSYQGSWTSLPPLIKERSHHASIYHNNAVYVVGGRDAHVTLDSIEKFDMDTKKWVVYPPMPFPLHLPQLVIIKNKLYILGGWNVNPSDEVLEFDMDLMTFNMKALMPEICSEGTAVGFEDAIYALGGKLKSCLRYDPITDQWLVLQRSVYSHIWGPGFIERGKIIVCGGFSTDIIEEYDPESKTWKAWDLRMPSQKAMCFVLQISN
ncbi:hypothetical protein CAPTEDRAFT_195229 [Capitella teleta]|uniref:CARD domain-containing protein n=1 Tax=Capitella teleta TaxID=283909 RepID=R7UGC6_CAPTE|nr:hypothetical protein CAPTEDRAFT_195229 [Capitella teleta]|eukprot:ELU02342.1 hypothetical protein CAPTEDRAFT_195229 [Capitella teleta]